MVDVLSIGDNLNYNGSVDHYQIYPSYTFNGNFSNGTKSAELPILSLKTWPGSKTRSIFRIVNPANYNDVYCDFSISDIGDSGPDLVYYLITWKNSSTAKCNLGMYYNNGGADFRITVNNP
jgi:hypothetical protein